ncbi:MAG TPA: hypothetical protein VFI96_08290 [Longimicrobiaceae bacterium]|nr:hypothetical protein [Longimicrobiaceae bacterium]
MSKEFEVEVVYRQRALYRVEAADRGEAEREAIARWQGGAESEVAGYDWSELEHVHSGPAPPSTRLEQDAELVLRFLRERERLIRRLGGEMYHPSVNDAISAHQVASDLGWSRSGDHGSATPDVGRSAEALEWLCSMHKVTCFERPRVRSGERGEIRLYCTPQYLELLASDLEEPDRRAAV